MDNQHRLIKGYRDLSEDEIAMMNDVKAMGEQLGRMCDALRSVGTLDQEWVHQAELNLKVGIMFAVRAIAKPTSF